MTANEKKPKKTDTKEKQEESTIGGRVAALRVFRVVFSLADAREDEMVMAYHCTFPHPGEVLFHDIAFEGDMILQYVRRALKGWIDVREETPANTGSTQVQ